MNRSDCPDPVQLLELLGGKSDSDSAERLEAHLLECETCALSAETLFPENEVTAFRESTPIPFEDSRDERIVEALIHRGKALRTDLGTVAPEQTQIGMSMDDDDVLGDSKASRSESDSSDDLSYLEPPQQPDEIGRLGDYRILQVLGRGGMGVVFRAEDPRLKRQIALKVMKPSIAASRSAKDRFLREAQFTAAIEHDHIVHIYQVGEDRGVPFIAMPFLKGESLKTKLEREGRLKQSEVVRIGKEVAAGLAAAHDRGLIHRDIKPDNIWIEEKTGRAKILDFGLVRSVSDDTELTQSGMVLGTPKYMAPEQAQGQSVDHRCDLFSLGSVLYHLATGKPAFEGNNLTATLMAVVHQEPQPIEAVSPDIHPQLANVIGELVKKDRNQRPQSAIEVSQRLADIEQALKNPSLRGAADTLPNGFLTGVVPNAATNIGEVSIVTQPVIRRTPPKPPQSRKLAMAAGAGGLLLALGILIITIRNKDGKETTIRVPDGVVADIDVQSGSKVSIREEASEASDTGNGTGMNSGVVDGRDLPTRSRKNVQNEASPDKPKLWPAGPLPSWASNTAPWAILKEGSVVPGAVERPAEFKEIGRWNVDTVQSRGVIIVARFSPDGKWLATGSSDGHVRIYEAATMKLHQLLPGAGGGNGAGAGDLSWHPDSLKIAVAADSSSALRIWTIEGRLLHEEINYDITFEAVAWTFDGSRLICGGANRLDVRDADGKLLKSLTEGQPVLYCSIGNIAASRNSQRFVSWHQDKARIWNAETFELEHTVDIPASNSFGGHRIRWSSNDQISLSLVDRLVICGTDGKVVKEFPSEHLGAMAWRPDGKELTIWRLEPYQLNTETGETTPVNDRMFVSPATGPAPTAIDWSPDGKYLVVAAGRLAVCNESLNMIEFDTSATLMSVSSVSLNPDGTQIASVSMVNDDSVRIWTSDGTVRRVMPLDEGVAYRSRVAWSPAGQHIAFFSPQSDRLQIGSLEGSFQKIAGHFSSVAWNPDGTQLAAGRIDGHLLITDNQGKTLHDVDTGESGAVVVGWSKQGMLVAYVGKKILRINPDSAESRVSLLTDVPVSPNDNFAVWRPDGVEIFISPFHVNVADGVTDRVREVAAGVGLGEAAVAAWAPDGMRYLQNASVVSLLLPDGTQSLYRRASATISAPGAWSPSGETVYVGCDQSLLMSRNAEDLHVKWSAVILPNEKSVTFDVGGSVLDADRETLDDQFVYYTANEAGNVSLLSPTEFELKTGEEILPVPGRFFDTEYGFSINTGDDWKPAPLESVTVPGFARAVFSKAGGVSLNLFIQDTGDLVDASWMLAESAKAQEEKLSATVLEKEVRKIAGRDAMWMIVEGRGNGSAIDGKGPVKTTQHWIAIPREKDVLVALLTSPSGTFASNQALFLKAIETLKLRSVTSTP
jgi:serine/threonine protein kinase/WD40 repeat protein